MRKQLGSYASGLATLLFAAMLLSGCNRTGGSTTTSDTGGGTVSAPPAAQAEIEKAKRLGEANSAANAERMNAQRPKK